ncbi:MAG: hypothetical protein KC912_17510 [Proteobacteria bacterium]|nr:hypothetical protein [Pseudomonadota bacterium]
MRNFLFLAFVVVSTGCPIRSGMARVDALPSADRSTFQACAYSDQAANMPRFRACGRIEDAEEQLTCFHALHHEYADQTDLEARTAWLRAEGCDPDRR